MSAARLHPFSANLDFLFGEHAFVDRFAAAADAGFGAVEFLFPYSLEAERIARLLEVNDLEVSVFNAPPGDWALGERGLAALAGRQADFRESLVLALRYAEILRVPRLHVLAGVAEPDDPAARALYEANLRWALEKAGEAPVGLMIEPLNGADMPGYFLRDFADAARIVTALAGEGLALQFDIYHCARIHGDVPAWLRRLAHLIGHVQIAGPPGRHEPRSPDLPLREIFATLRDIGYAGFIGCEYRPRAGTLQGLGWLEPYL